MLQSYYEHTDFYFFSNFIGGQVYPPPPCHPGHALNNPHKISYIFTLYLILCALVRK